MIKYGVYPSPLGDIHLARTDDGLFRAALDGSRKVFSPHLIEKRYGLPAMKDYMAFTVEMDYLENYFSGQPVTVNFPLHFMEGTPFERTVWQALTRIPYGEVITYGELARRVDNPGAARAVGRANGKNPIAIIVPCHRVVASNGRLGGFSSGLDRKVFLLRNEGHTVDSERGITFNTRLS